MEYVANPVIVDAYKIDRCLTDESGNYQVRLDNGLWQTPTLEMMARYKPTIGDYWVIQSDGYVYLNPADVFERKYSPLQGTDSLPQPEIG